MSFLDSSRGRRPIVVIPASSTARVLVGAAIVIGQVAAAGAGALSWPIVVICAPLTALVMMRPVVKSVRWRQIAAVGSLLVLVAVGVLLQRRTVGGSLVPTSTLRPLTGGLAVLSVLLGSVWNSVREYRTLLAMAGVSLIAAAANASPGVAAVPLVLGWLVLIAAAWVVQADAIAASASKRAMVTVDGAPASVGPSYKAKGLASCLGVVALAGWLVYLVLPGQLGGGGLGTRIASAAGLTPPTLQETRGEVGVDTDGSGTLDLDVRGALPDTPLLSVPSSSPQLWQATTYRDYTGQSWGNGPNPSNSAVKLDGSTVTLPHNPADPPAVGSRDETDRVQVLQSEVDGAEVSVLWAPGVPLRVTAPSVHTAFLSEGSVRLFALGPISQYSVTTAVPPTSPKLLAAAGDLPPDAPDWLQLPATLPLEVRQLAQQITAGQTTIYGKVTALESYLRSHEKYSLSSPVPGPGQDAVDRFLFHDHVGFCEQFASAETVMLRTLGIPARLVTGLAYGTPDGNRRTITEADAHAWTEVDYPRIGWVPTDPTAGVSLAPATRPLLSRIGHDLWSIAAKLPAGIAGLAALVALLLIGVMLLRIRRRRSTPDQVSGGPVLSAFHRFAARGRRPTETARDYVARVAIGPERTALDSAVGTLEQEIYGAEPPAGDDVANAVDVFTR